MVPDRSTISSSIVDWNGWWSKGNVPESLLGRQRILEIPMDLLLERKEIKTVSGIRRCGKSTLIYQIISNLIDGGTPPENIVMINFDDKALSGIELELALDIYRELINPRGKMNIFLDEVHNCPDWVSTLRKMYDLARIDTVFVTDSSSKYISGEYTVLISGRTLDMRIHPLSFREFVQWTGDVDPDRPMGTEETVSARRNLDQFLRWGGYPEVVLAKSDLQRKIILKDYLDTIIYKDLVERYNANHEKLKIMVGYLLSNISSLFSPRRFSRRHGFSLETIYNYLRYMKEVNFIHTVPGFDFSYDKVLRSQKKIFIEDPGLAETFGFKFSEGKGKLLENAVFNELNRRGFELFYWSDGKRECDLIVKHDMEIPLAIQVCHELREENVEREVSGLEGCMNAIGAKKGIIVLGDGSDLDTNGFEKVDSWRFLLDVQRYIG